jgi:hypothetical protein
VPGFRVGAGPRGNYVHLGRGGVYYRHTFPAHRPAPSPLASPHGALQEIESGSADAIVDSTSEALLEELRARRRKLALRPFGDIAAGRQTLYFLPDRLLVYDAAGIGAVSYRTLDVSAVRQRFIESSGVPADATVVDHTWRYVNKSGGPDRRFRDNVQIPVCLYDELTFRTPSGLHEIVQVSRSGVGEGFAAAVRHLASVTP